MDFSLFWLYSFRSPLLINISFDFFSSFYLDVSFILGYTYWFPLGFSYFFTLVLLRFLSYIIFLWLVIY